MQAIKDMLGSERALIVLALVIGVTVLAAIGTVSVADWQTYTKELAFVFIGSKTVTTAIEVLKSPPTKPPTPPGAPPAGGPP